MAERKKFIADWAGLSQLSRAVPHARDQPRVKRLSASGNPSSFWGCSAVTHLAGLALPRPPSTAKIISRVAGRVPLSAQRPAHPEILVSQGSNVIWPRRLPEGVRLSGPMARAPRNPNDTGPACSPSGPFFQDAPPTRTTDLRPSGSGGLPLRNPPRSRVEYSIDRRGQEGAL